MNGWLGLCYLWLEILWICIRLIVNAHISKYINGFNVIQIGGDILFQDVSNDRSYAHFGWEMKKLWLFTKHRRTKISPDRAPLVNYDQANNAQSGPAHQPVWIQWPSDRANVARSDRATEILTWDVRFLLGLCAEYVLGFC